jgi:prevent-host-death family protein
MTAFTIHSAKTNLSQLITRAEAGEEIVLARGKQPVAKIVPLESVKPSRQFGRYRGMFEVGPEFFEPLPPDELDAWER